MRLSSTGFSPLVRSLTASVTLAAYVGATLAPRHATAQPEAAPVDSYGRSDGSSWSTAEDRVGARAPGFPSEERAGTTQAMDSENSEGEEGAGSDAAEVVGAVADDNPEPEVAQPQPQQALAQPLARHRPKVA